MYLNNVKIVTQIQAKFPRWSVWKKKHFRWPTNACYRF